jgi:cytochrome c553
MMRSGSMLAAALLAPLAVCLPGDGAIARTVEERAAECVACHGPGGNSTTPLLPSIAGQPQFFLLNQLILIREGVRPIPEMADVLKGLKDEDAVALAERFAAAPVVRSDEPVDPALVKRGAELSVAMRCASCHMPNLEGAEQMPRLAGQRIDYMFEALKAYRDNRRAGADTNMTAVVFGASDADLEALSHYAASK